ncbi:MAG: type II toxin-antitoxin system Phd/YefM family antitoxin [Trueperaceae bacterium]
MATMASGDLTERFDEALECVVAGEDVFITVDGREVARVTQVSRKPRWVPKGAFLADLRRVQADAGLRADLDELAPDTTDDLGPL